MNREIEEELKKSYVEAAQTVYDQWYQDEDGVDVELGTGGICSLIADEAIGYFQQEGYDAWQTGDTEHAWVIVEIDGTVLEVDIPHNIYEQGGGYNWTKIPDVEFTVDNVLVWENKDVDTVLETCHLM